jgi:hypothetical protein
VFLRDEKCYSACLVNGRTYMMARHSTFDLTLRDNKENMMRIVAKTLCSLVRRALVMVSLI